MAPSQDDPTTNSSSGKEEEVVSESEPEPELDNTLPSPTTTNNPSASFSSGDEESDSDPSPKISSKPDPSIKPKPMDSPPKPVTKPSASGEEELEEKVSESESEPDKTLPSAQTTTTKNPSASSSSEHEESEAKPDPPAYSSPVKSGKRPAPVPKTKTHESKKAKKSGNDTAKKTNLFQRVWSEEDEVAILKGMIEYTFADMNEFHDIIQKSVHVEVSKTQLADKVRKLKKKYKNNFKQEQIGKERNFWKPHEKICYNLSKKIWGSNGGEDSIVKVDKVKSSGTVKMYQIQNNGSVLVPAEADEDKGVTAMEVDCNSGGSVVRGDYQMVRNGWKLVTGPKKSEWEKKWKKLMDEEFELYTKFLGLKHEQAKLIMEDMKSAQD